MDGEVKELDEAFSNGLMFPGDPDGPAEEVCNCRCALLQRVRSALNSDETKILGNIDEMTDKRLEPLAEKLHISVDELRGYSGQIIPIKAKDYDDFKQQYNKIWNDGVALSKNSVIINNKGKLSNVEVRKWYINENNKIPLQIDKTQPLEEQALQAYFLRNRNKFTARELMADKKARKELDITEKSLSFEEMIADKMKRKNMSRDEALNDIISTGTKMRQSVNENLGV